MAAGNWVDWNTGDLVTEAAFQDIQDSIVFIYASEAAANTALTNKVEGTIFYDTTANLIKAWNGSAWITAESGDIEGVTAGTGLSGGGTSGTVTVNFDPNGLTAAAVDVANDSIAIIDSNDSNNPKKESIADLATAMADGTTVTASSGVLSAAGGGKVLQVIQATTSTSTNTTATTYGNTTLSGSITPSATDSKILLLISQTMDTQSNTTQNQEVALKVVQTISATDTDIYENTAFMKINADYGAFGYAQTRGTYAVNILDSPSTTSAVTYKTMMKNVVSGGSATAQTGNQPSHMILIEIGA